MFAGKREALASFAERSYAKHASAEGAC